MDLKYNTVLFDFDGTVIDSGPGILKCARETIGEFGLPMPDESILNRFIGPPLKRSFMDTFETSPALSDELVACYRKKYRESEGIMDAYIYEGMEELLTTLNDAGATVAIASAKQEPTVRETLRRFDMLHYFKAVAGASPTVEYADKTDIMRDCLERLDVSPSDAVMIGDSGYDAHSSNELGVDFCAVMWGYGFNTVEDLKKFRCRYIAEDVPSLRRFLLVD